MNLFWNFLSSMLRKQLIRDTNNVRFCEIRIQIQDGQNKKISYVSKTLSDVEKKYSTTEK